MSRPVEQSAGRFQFPYMLDMPRRSEDNCGMSLPEDLLPQFPRQERAFSYGRADPRDLEDAYEYFRSMMPWPLVRKVPPRIDREAMADPYRRALR